MIKPLWPYPAALVETQKTRVMVIADLHIGWEMALTKKGIHVPTQMHKLLGKLSNLLSEYNPDRLIVLGDVKHTVATAELGEWHDVPDFFRALRKQIQEVCIIRGNHDGNLEPLLPESVRLLPATGQTLGNVGLFHGHKWPLPDILKCNTLIMAHVHPVVAFRDPAGFRITRQVWVKASCDRERLAKVLSQKHRLKSAAGSKTTSRHDTARSRTIQLFIMPSFNDFLGGKPLNESRSGDKARAEMIVGPVLRSEAVDMGSAETYLLDGTFLGTLNQLRSLG